MRQKFFYSLSFLLSLNLSYASISKATSLLRAGKITEGRSLLISYAQKGDCKGSFVLSLSYLFGNDKKVDEGLKLLKYAANRNYPPALDTLAGLYLHGDFVPQDKAQALSLYERAARLGYGPSQFNCGILYGKEGFLKNDEKSYIYLSLAALNVNDLELMTEDAAHYRDRITPHLTPAQRTSAALTIFHSLFLPRQTDKPRQESQQYPIFDHGAHRGGF